MRRVMIVGAPGSGKSTLVRQMAKQLGLPVYHMDHLHHLPGWQPRPLAEKQDMARAIEQRDEWIFEGGMSSTYDSRAARADTLIWLDLHIALRLWRVTKRLWQHYGKRRPDMAEGCVETIGAHTWEFYVWIISTRRSQRTKIAALAKNARPGLRIVHLTSPNAVASYVAQIDPGNAQA